MSLDNLEEFRAHDQIAALREANQTLSTQLLQAKNKGVEIVNAVYRAAYDATLVVGQPVITSPAKDKRTSSPEVALWHMTDWQGAKLTTSYNSEVMKERVRRFVDKAIAITEIQRADHPVKDCTIMFGGDMVEGLWNFPTQPHEVDQTIFGQFVTVSALIREVVGKALENYEHVTVVPEWGNHGRMGSKRDAIPKSDNLDRMCYELARQLLDGEKRLTWQSCEEDIQRVEIGNYRALLMHGDEVGRTGFASPAAWQAAGNRWKAGAYGWQFPRPVPRPLPQGRARKPLGRRGGNLLDRIDRVRQPLRPRFNGGVRNPEPASSLCEPRARKGNRPVRCLGR